MSPECQATWAPVSLPPAKAGIYLVANIGYKSVNQARWLSKKQQWKFPSAAMAFEIDVWTVLPKPPQP